QLFNKFCFGKSIGKRKIIIVISHLKGKEPDGSSAMNVKRLCHIKMYVEKYVMFPISRFGGNKNFIIWEDGAKKAWGEDYDHKVLELPKGKKKPKPKSKPKEMQMSVPAEPVTKLEFAESAEPPLFKD
ncbi:MAG: hypothetical protein NTZ59_11705, partial [Bacteroidetes bacterium]|nr:hypothetical protein [Bacteroidota bacterium]